ncbi:MAG: pyridine nucleotide-disulfide oxidoreductase, partial [Ginsengibacter sp.]
ILMAKAGHKVILFEKEKYPFHRVCGEYISLESRTFIENLGLDLSKLKLPIIKRLIVSSPNGDLIESKLDMGGFGVSRYFIDNELKKIAVDLGVTLLEETKVNYVSFKNEIFTVLHNGGSVNCNLLAGTYGKRSNLDIKWSRHFIKQKPGKLNNYIGVKYHVRTAFPIDTIALHNFENGYCGLSKIEDDRYCLCYLTTAQNLKKNNSSIKEMEKNVLHKNPFLKAIFSEAEFIFKEPVTISQISFDKKSQVENHVLMIGDSAGMITPLCGNGMSMAFHSSKIASQVMKSYLQGVISREAMEAEYTSQWKKLFAKRLTSGRMIQKLFGKTKMTNFFIASIKHFPFLVAKMIKATHGKEF